MYKISKYKTYAKCTCFIVLAGVVANIAAFHAAARGSIPRRGITFALWHELRSKSGELLILR